MEESPVSETASHLIGHEITPDEGEVSQSA
jgi:hypothetical protein